MRGWGQISQQVVTVDELLQLWRHFNTIIVGELQNRVKLVLIVGQLFLQFVDGVRQLSDVRHDRYLLVL